MAINVNPPDSFDFDRPEGWPAWSSRFTRYMSLSGLDQKPEDEKINVLLYVMGSKSGTIIKRFLPAPATLQATLDAFDTAFIPKHHVIFHRVRFNKRDQQQGESIETYFQDLHLLVEKCNYGTLKEEMIRDRLVTSMLDRHTSDSLQLRDKLTLTEAIESAKQAEALRSQRKYDASGEVAAAATINRIQHHQKSNRKPREI